MASSEVEKIIEPVTTQEVEGVKSYLTPEVEAAVVNLAKSDKMQLLQYSLPEGKNSSFPEVPEGEMFLESSSNGAKVSGQDLCGKEQVTGQADESISGKSDQDHHESIKEAGLDAVMEDRVSSGIEAGKQISTPEMISLVQNEAAAPETCLENGSKDNGLSSGFDAKELEPENEKEVTATDMATPVGSEVADKETVVETGLLEEEKPADSVDVKTDGVFLQEKNSIAVEANETAEIAEAAKIYDDKPDKAVEAETVAEKTINSVSLEEENEQKEAAEETEKHIESESRELGEPAAAELVIKTAESETNAEKVDQIHEPDSKETPEIHDTGTSKEKEVPTEAEAEAFNAQTPELETKSNDDDIVRKEESSKENATVGDAAEDDKVEELVKEGTVEDLKIDDQSARKDDIATPVGSEVPEKENAEEIGVQEEEKTADSDDVRVEGVVLQAKNSDVTEANETVESAEAKISDDKPDEGERIAETVETQQNEAPAEIENHIERESSTRELTTAESVTKTDENEKDAEKQEEICQPDSSEAPKVHDDTGTSKEEEEVQRKEEASDAQNTELESKSYDDDTVKMEETTSSIGVDEVTEASETTAVSGEETTIDIVKQEVDVQKEEISTENVKGDDAVDGLVEEPVKEGTAEELKIDDPNASKETIEESERVDSGMEEPEKTENGSEVTLQTSHEGIEEGGELQKKEEGESLEQEKDEKPSVETSEEAEIITPVASSEDKKEEAEVSNKDTTETVDESSPCIEETQDHESMDSTVQTSLEKEEGSLESETLVFPVESNEKSKRLEEVPEISNKEISKVAEEVEQFVIPASVPEADGNSSSKLDDVAEEKTEIPNEDDKGDLLNENPATVIIEHSNREELEQSETAAKFESSSNPDETEQNGEVVNETAPTSLSNHGETPSGEAETTTETETSVEDQMEEPVKEATVEELGVDGVSASKEIEQNEKSPEAALVTSPEGEKIEALPMEEKETEKGESKNEGIEEEEVHKKTEQDEVFERATEVPLVNSEDAEVVQEGTGEHIIHETDQKPSVEASKDTDIVITPRASPENDTKKEEAEESNKETTETVDEPATATQGHESLESEALGLEEVSEISNKEAPETGEVTEEAEGNSSSTVDDVVQERVDMPEEESHATESIEASPVEDLQKDEQKVELSNEEVLEQSETAAEVESSTPHETERDDEVVNGTASTTEAKTEVAEIVEKKTSKGEELESVPQEEKEQEMGTSAEENPEKPVAEYEIATEESGDITAEDDKGAIEQKEVPEIIQAADEVKELKTTIADEVEPAKEMAEAMQSETVLEPVLGGEVEKNSVPEEKVSVEPEEMEVIDTTQRGNLIEEVKESIPSSTESDKATDFNEQTEVVASASIQDAPTLDQGTLVEETTEDENTILEGTEKSLLAEPAKESEETSKKETIEEEHEEKKPPSDAVCESIIPVAGILESAALQEEEVEGNVEPVVSETEAIPEQLPEEKHVVQSSDIPSHEDDYETKAVIENTEEEKTKDVIVSQPDTPDDPLELETTEETSLKEVQPREFEAEASIANKLVEEQDKEEAALQTVEEEIKEASEGVEATTGDKLTDEKSIEEEKAEEQQQAEASALLAKEEEDKESSNEVSVSDEIDHQKQEASGFTGNEAVKDDEVPSVQALLEEPEVLQNEPKQTEEGCKAEEVEKETQGKEIQEEVNSPAVDITEETREIPEAAKAENVPKQTEEDEVEALVEQDKVEKQVEKSDDISGAETIAATTEISDGTAEDRPNQAEEESAEQQEARESENVQKEDEAAVATEEKQEVSAFTIMAEDEPTKEAEEASRPVEQVSREFQVSELEPEVEKGPQGSEGSAITEEIKEVSEVVPVSGTQETKPLKENEISHHESLPVEKPEEPEASETSEPIEETFEEAKEMEDEASLIKEEPIVELGLPKEGQEEKEEASNFEFPGFMQPKQLEQQAATECPTAKEESKETAETQERTVDISNVTKKETLESASEGSSQAVIANPEDDNNAVNGNQQEGPRAEQVIKEEEIIKEMIPEEEIEPKESQNEEVSHEKESIPSEGDVKIVEEEEAKVKTEVAKAEATTVIDKELGTEISQRDLPLELVEEATSEKQISTEAKPCAADETINPAKLSLFDMMAKSTREKQVVHGSAEEKESITGKDETKPGEAEPEKTKSDGEKEHDEEEERQEGEDNHKNDSGSDGLVIVEASKEAEVKVVTTQKKSHNILSEVGSKVKHSISKVRKVITGKSPKQHSAK